MGDVIALPPRRQAHPEQPTVEKPLVEPPLVEPLWREAVGNVLRDERHRQQRTLADVGGESGVSVQYLSEVERGRKEPSSEILGAVAGALGLRLVDLASRVARSLQAAPRGPLALAA